jgi:Outer membrane protein beta-barrel domain
MRFAKLLAVLCFLVLTASALRAQDAVEVFGGYSYVRGAVPVSETILCPGPPCPVTTPTYNSNLNGFELSGTYKPSDWFGFTADLGGNFGATQNASTHLETFLFGPQISLPSRVSPFAHVLFGAAHESIGFANAGGGLATIPTSQTAFAAAVGAGIDIEVAPFVSFRPIQLDYLLTRFNSATQRQPRFSAGLVFHF